ncbi:MAG: NfeD family protein [Lachnospiraceae bacterium]|nr:NfeD family protein [Lachnospiraceae bacterium]
MWMIVWLVIAAIMIISEIVSLGLTSIWFAGGALIADLAAHLGAHWAVQLVIFAAVSMVLLIFTRPIVAKRMIKEPVKTNVESLIGQRAVVKEDVDNLKGTGMVVLNGIEWTARAAEDVVIEKDSSVEIVEIKGVKLIVKNI